MLMKRSKRYPLCLEFLKGHNLYETARILGGIPFCGVDPLVRRQDFLTQVRHEAAIGELWFAPSIT